MFSQPLILIWNKYFTARCTLMWRRPIFDHDTTNPTWREHQIECSLDGRARHARAPSDAADHVLTGAHGTTRGRDDARFGLLDPVIDPLAFAGPSFTQQLTRARIDAL